MALYLSTPKHNGKSGTEYGPGKDIVQMGLGDDGSDTNTLYNGKREIGLYSNSTEMSRR
jgi:hypothetical protein